uniref:Putative NAC transcription factor 25-like n=1 Tax=Davidia involucrata TaxID=16924 RepID=A0A5B7BXI4_DAVIN
MDKLNSVKEGVIKLPPGFRFQPTDEEIVFEYLARKIFCCPLPASIILEINVCKYDPWDLPGESEQDRYFYSNKEAKYRNGIRTNRATDSGYWKATGLDKQIICSRRKHIMGMKKTLVFYKGRSTNGSRTDWVMHEYRLVNSVTADCNSQQTKNSTQNSLTQKGNWVLCRIFLKKRSTKNEDEIVQACTDDRVKSVMVAQPRLYDFMMTEVTDLGPTSSSSSSSPSSSSGSKFITGVSSSGLDHEATSD